MELRKAMADTTHGLILWRTEHSLMTLTDLANVAGLHPELVEKFVDYGLIEPSPGTGSGPLFPADAVKRLRCIMRLRRDLGVNLAGVAVILEMRERVETLQRELELLRRRP
jgi:MerR family transcriptional regulator, heat shock protein HspR